MEKKYLNANEIKDFIKMLAGSQGLYSRLYAALTEEDYQELEKKEFKDKMEIVFYIEGF